MKSILLRVQISRFYRFEFDRICARGLTSNSIAEKNNNSKVQRKHFFYSSGSVGELGENLLNIFKCSTVAFAKYYSEEPPLFTSERYVTCWYLQTRKIYSSLCFVFNISLTLHVTNS